MYKRQALSEAARLTGARPWLAEDRCRELFRQGRVNAADLEAALRQLPEVAVDEALLAGTACPLRRREVLKAALLNPVDAVSPARLRWQGEEMAAFERWRADLEPAVRQALLTATGADGVDERAAVSDLWAAAVELRGPLAMAQIMASARPAATRLAERLPETAAVLWQAMLGRLGHDWTVAALLAHLTGEDVRESLHPTLIRHLAAHLDQGLAAWPNPCLLYTSRCV